MCNIIITGVCLILNDKSSFRFQIVHILSVPTNQLLSYSTGRREESVRQLKRRIETETTIAADLQEIFSSSGEELGENTLIKDYAGDYVRTLLSLGGNRMYLMVIWLWCNV